ANNFFFQAEDGIRDRNVTGVQTCALPIYARPARPTIHPNVVIWPWVSTSRARDSGSANITRAVPTAATPQGGMVFASRRFMLQSRWALARPLAWVSATREIRPQTQMTQLSLVSENSSTLLSGCMRVCASLT